MVEPRYVRHLEDLVRQLSATAAVAGPEQTDHHHRTPSYISSREPPSGLYNADYAQAADLPRAHALMEAADSASTVSRGSRQSASQEVSGVNRHTHNVEFYGRSSSVALLSQVQRSGGDSAIATAEGAEGCDGAALVSNLHNPAFSPAGEAASHARGPEEEAAAAPFITSHYPQCRGFLQGFFSSIHYIHPILDKAAFLRRCELLWRGDAGAAAHGSSFAALYYSILSLGALVGARDDEPVDGIGNLQWSRRFFDEARSRCSRLGMVTDLDMVQCYFFMVGKLLSSPSTQLPGLTRLLLTYVCIRPRSARTN